MLKPGGPRLPKQLQSNFNNCLEIGQIPDSWKTEVILFDKKGDIADLNNYRFKSLLPQICKLFTRVLASRLTTKIDQTQSREQAGFCSGFSDTPYKTMQ